MKKSVSPKTGRPPIENPKNTRIQIRLDKQTLEKLDICAKQKNNDKPPSDKAQFIVVTDRKLYLKSIVHQIGFSVNYIRKDFYV